MKLITAADAGQPDDRSHFVLLQLLGKLTKFGWFNTQGERHVFRSITDDIGQFIRGPIEHCIIGIKVLAELVSLINQV